MGIKKVIHSDKRKIGTEPCRAVSIMGTYIKFELGSVVTDMREAIRWKIRVPIFKNTVILKQLGIAIGIPFGLVALIIVLISKGSRDALYALGLIAALLFLTWLLIMVAYRGKYDAEFVLDNKGVICRTQAKQSKKNRVINTLTIMLGLLTSKPTVAGAGLLAQSRQEVFILWSRVTKVKYKPQSLTILIHCGWTEQIALFCTQDNYALVERFVLQRTGQREEVSRK